MPPSGRSSKNWRVDREGKAAFSAAADRAGLRAEGGTESEGTIIPKKAPKETKITVIPVLQRFLHWLREATRSVQRARACSLVVNTRNSEPSAAWLSSDLRPRNDGETPMDHQG
jgi:hypothetical protein